MFDWWDGYFKTREQLKYWRTRYLLRSKLCEDAEKLCTSWREKAEKLEEENFTLRKVICGVSNDKLIAAYEKLKED